MWLHSIAYRLGQVRQQLGFVAPLSEADHKEVACILPSTSAQSLFRTMSPADQQHALRVCRGLQARGCTDNDMLAAALLHDVGKANGRVPFWTRPAIVIGKKLAPQLLSRLVIYPENISTQTSSLSNLNPLYRIPVSRRGGGGVDVGWGRLRRPRPALRPTALPHLPQKPPCENPSMVGAIPCGRPVPIDGRPIAADGLPAAPSPEPRTPPIPNWRQSLSNAWYHANIGAELASAAGLPDRAVLYIRTHHQPNGPAAELYKVDEVS